MTARDTPRSDSRTLLGTVCERFVAVSRYDLVLVVIPAAFLLASVAGSVLSIPSRTAILAAACLAALAVGDALFRNPPGPDSA